ncbi:MAG: double zinc ribbon domain-containing protein [Mycobacteriales bacterium]
MDQAHCAECGATLAPDAPWCTLCFAPVRVPEPAATASTPEPARPAGPHPLYPHITPASFDQPAVTWPCAQCSAPVPMSADVCPACGASFLTSGALPALKLPIVGDLTARSKAQQFAIAGVIGLGASIVVVAVIALLGALF